MPGNGEALVTPNQAWTEDGTATVAPVPPFQEHTPRTLPVDNRTSGTHTVSRSAYPGGLVIIPTGNEPGVSPATLPILASGDDHVVVTGDNYVVWPDGFVIWFLVQ